MATGGLGYCAHHYGLMLLLARRHDCRACYLLYVVALCLDMSHSAMVRQWAYAVRREAGYPGGTIQYAVHRFCDPDGLMDGRQWPQLATVAFTGTKVSGGSIAVPANSFVYYDANNKHVVAFVKLERLDASTGAWLAVTTPAEYQAAIGGRCSHIRPSSPMASRVVCQHQ